VVVTSRGQLTGLVATGEARLLTVGLLTEPEARELLAGRLGTGRVEAKPEAVDELIRLCVRLPLALAITAARAAARPGHPLWALAAELRTAGRRLDALDAGEPAASVPAVFSWSYDQLSPAAARMFRLLGLHPGPDITAAAAASLADVELPQARQLLAELAGAHLCAEHDVGRYAFHDLLRAYAAEQARTLDSGPDRHAAVGRVLDHYLTTAYAAALLVNPSRKSLSIPPPQPGVTAEQLADEKQALAWFRAEHHVLLAAATLAAESGFDGQAWQLPWAMEDYLDSRGDWHELAAIQRSALDAATRLRDVGGQAAAHRAMAAAHTQLGRYELAHAHLADSLELYRRLGDRAGEARVHLTTAWVCDFQERHADALGHCEQALGLFEALGDQVGQARALASIGWCHAHLGWPQQARTFCRRALDLLGGSFTPVSADADPVAAGQLIDPCRPGVLVLNAGATPLPRPVQYHTWESFSRNWEVDVQHVFHLTREALLAPLLPGSTVITLSGGYAGAKAATRSLTAYAAEESSRDKLGTRFVSRLPQLTPATDLGAAYVKAYAARQDGGPGGTAGRAGGAPLTPEQAGQAIAELAADPSYQENASCSPPRAFARWPEPMPDQTPQNKEQQS